MNNEIWKVLLIQLALSFLYAGAVAVWKTDALFSAIVGCMAGLIPNTYIYYRMARQVENNNATQRRSVVFIFLKASTISSHPPSLNKTTIRTTANTVPAN